MTQSKKYKSGIEVFWDSDKKRVWCLLPVSVSDLGKRSPLYKKVNEVCGEGAVLAFEPSNLMGAMAFCPPEEGGAWAAEIRQSRPFLKTEPEGESPKYDSRIEGS